MSESNLVYLKKRLLYQSTHRGCKELDLILGKFATTHLEALTTEQIKIYELFCDEDDAKIYSWIVDDGKEICPKMYTEIVNIISEKTFTESHHSAALLIIGNEILSGKTRDLNLQSLALSFNPLGIRIRQVRMVPDVKDEIILAVNALRREYTYVFTSGGIGPTHDDITTEAIAEAFGVETEVNLIALTDLDAFYKKNNQQLNNSRVKMARIPKGATLIKNSISSAPGFQMGNVFVLAGVPRIFNAMLVEVITGISKECGTKPIISKKILLSTTEGEIAEDLEKIQQTYQNVEIGSYPQESGITEIVLTSYSEKDINTCFASISLHFAKWI